jgi:hypothetical protein
MLSTQMKPGSRTPVLWIDAEITAARALVDRRSAGFLMRVSPADHRARIECATVPDDVPGAESINVVLRSLNVSADYAIVARRR